MAIRTFGLTNPGRGSRVVDANGFATQPASGFSLNKSAAPVNALSDTMRFTRDQANETGQQDVFEIPRWLYDQAGSAGGKLGYGNDILGGRNMTTRPGAVGDTTYKVGNMIFSGAHGGGLNTGQGMDAVSSRFLDPNSFVSYENSPAYQQALKTGQWSILNGTPYNVLDSSGKVIGTKKFEGLEDSDNLDEIMMAVTGAGLGGMAMAGAAAGGGAGATGTAGTSAMGAAPSSFGVVDGTVGAGIGGSTGTGLTFGGGTTGLSAGAGSGLSLSNGATGLGMTSGSAGAGGIGGGLGTGFAGGSGTLLGPAALAGTTTLSNGLTLAPAAGGGTAAMGSGAATGAGGTGAGGAAAGAGSSLIPGIPNSAIGAGVSLLGGIMGAQGQNASTSASRELPAYLKAPVANDLIPRTQGLLNTQMPVAQTAGNQLLQVGTGLLGQTAPTTATNPYLKSIADDLQRRTTDVLGQNNLAIQGNAVATGGLGGSRQGVAQGIAAGNAADSLQGNIANLYGGAYNQDMNRLLQQQTLGAGLVSQGLSTPFQPLKSATDIYGPFTGFGTTTQNASSGGGLQGAVGGALGAAQFGRSMGWW